jgi:hypothetical protein
VGDLGARANARQDGPGLTMQSKHDRSPSQLECPRHLGTSSHRLANPEVKDGRGRNTDICAVPRAAVASPSMIRRYSASGVKPGPLRNLGETRRR